MTRRRDLEVALTFSADGDELVATTRVSTAELAKLGDEAERTGQQAGRAGDQIDTMGRQSRQAGGNARALWDNVMGLKGAIIGLTGAVGGLSLGRFTGDVIGVASETENLEVRLRVLLGSVEEGNRLLGNMQHLASRLPFSFADVADPATTLSGVMQGGVDEVTAWMPVIADLAAASGLGIQQSTEQIVRMYSAGAGAADLFRERGVLAMLGFEAGVSYSAEETRVKLIEAFLDPASKFKGATTEMAVTWDGTVNMLGDLWRQFRQDVADAGVFDEAKAAIKGVLTDLQELQADGTLAEWASNVGRAMVAAATGTMVLVEILAVGGIGYLAISASTTALIALQQAVLSAGLAATTAAGGVGALTLGLGASAKATWAQIAAFGVMKSAVTGLFALFAGFKIGSWLREEFHQARLAGLAFLESLLVGWAHLKSSIRSWMEFIGAGWDTLMQALGNRFAGLLETIGSALSRAPMLDQLAEQTNAAADAIRRAVTPARTLTERFTALQFARDQEIESIRRHISGLVDYEIQVEYASIATGKSAKASDDSKTSLDELLERYRALMNAQDAAGKKTKDTAKVVQASAGVMKEAADPIAEAYEQAVGRIDRLFVDLWASALDGMDDFVAGVKQTLKRLVGEVVQANLRKAIFGSLGIGGAAAPGAALASAGGLGNLGGLGALFGGGGGISQGAGNALAGLASLFGDGTSAFGTGIGDVATLVSQQGILSGLGSSFGDLGSLFTGGGLQALGGALPAIGTVIGGLALVDKLTGGKLFGTSYQTTATGLDLAIGGLDVSGSSFEVQERQRALGRGTRRRTLVTGLDPELEAVLEGQLQTVSDGLRSMSRQLGIAGGDIGDFTARLRVDTTGLDAEAAQAEIERAFGRVLRGMATGVLRGIPAFARAGETFQQTFERLSGVVETIRTLGRDLDLAIAQLAGRTSAARASLAVATSDITELYAQLGNTGDLETRINLEQQLADQVQGRYRAEQQMLEAVADAIGAALGQARALRATIGNDIRTLDGTATLRGLDAIAADVQVDLPGLPDVLGLIEARNQVVDLQRLTGGAQLTQGAANVAQEQYEATLQAINQALSGALPEFIGQLRVGGGDPDSNARDRLLATPSAGGFQALFNPALASLFPAGSSLEQVLAGLRSGTSGFGFNINPNIEAADALAPLIEQYNAAINLVQQANAAPNLGGLAELVQALGLAQQRVDTLQADFAERFAGYAEAATANIRSLSGLRDETLAYVEAQRQLEQQLARGADQIGSTLRDLATINRVPVAQSQFLREEFEQAFAATAGLDGAALAAAAGRLDALAQPLIDQARDTFASGQEFQDILAFVQGALGQVQGRLLAEDLGDYETDSLALLGAIDDALGGIEDGLVGGERAVQQAIEASTAQTVDLLQQIRDLLAQDQGLLVTGALPNGQAELSPQTIQQLADAVAQRPTTVEVIGPNGETISQQVRNRLLVDSRNGVPVIFADGVRTR